MKDNVKEVAKKLNAEYINIRNPIRISGLLNTRLWRFQLRALSHMSELWAVQSKINLAYKVSRTSDEAITGMYDAEYNTKRGSHYTYLNTLQYPRGFKKITGYLPKETSQMKIIDIGAGSNEFLRFLHNEIAVPRNQLHATDISKASIEIINRDGFQGYLGRIENLSLPESFFDITFLSYFIDYDTNQRATFEETVRITKPNGKIILEGLFPSCPSGLLESDRTGLTFITKGDAAAEDIMLVCQAFQDIAKAQRKKILVEKIIHGWRYIYNRRGHSKLPSYFLVFLVIE